MDLLRFLAQLPVRLAALTKSLFQIVAKRLAPVLRSVFGAVSFSWSRPGWMPALAAHIRTQPRRYGGGALGLVAGIALAWGGWLWYRSLPHPPEPERITFEAPAPKITDYAPADGVHKIVIHPLDVKFSASAAPIELVGKRVTKGITMTPALKGTWSWSDDRTLHFVPAADWPVGAHVEVAFDIRQAFPPHVLMADDHFAFDMPAFSMTADKGEFYQDPANPTAKKTIMTLNFNYPVDPAELEKRIGLVLKGRGGQGLNKGSDPLKFTVTYDAAKIKAFVHSQPLALPRDDDAVRMTVDKGVRSARGGEATEDPRTMETNVPGLYSLRVQEVTPTLVNNDKFEPEQVVVITASDAVRGSDLANQVKAWILPRRKPGVRQADSEPSYRWGMSEVSEEVLPVPAAETRTGADGKGILRSPELQIHRRSPSADLLPRAGRSQILQRLPAGQKPYPDLQRSRLSHFAALHGRRLAFVAERRPADLDRIAQPGRHEAGSRPGAAGPVAASGQPQ